MNSSTVDTVNAAATAIVTAESRVQPTSVQKRRWSGCWSLYWCFGSYKQSKRISHALFVPESTAPGPTISVPENVNHSTNVVFPFIAPPSSPASFLQSDPPSATQSPLGLISLKSLSVNPHSQGVNASIFTVGPYAYDTQLVSPPVFSTFNTEPSTASFTPPPEPVQMTTPSSPEVPFAQLLTSSLARAKRNSGPNQKFSLSQYEFQPYQAYPGSDLVSPVSNSGTSSPFPDKQAPPVVEFRAGEAPKFLGYEHFSTYKWGSRLGSGSLTPNGLGSRLGSGSMTPNGWGSRLGSGTLTPNAIEPPSQDLLMETQISEVASLANSDHGSQNGEIIADHRVSFELTCEDVAICLQKNLDSSLETVPESKRDSTAESATEDDHAVLEKADGTCKYCIAKKSGKIVDEEKQCECTRRSITLGSSRDFNFDNTKGEVGEKPTIGCEWWTREREKAVDVETGSQKNWTFFPMLQPGVS